MTEPAPRPEENMPLQLFHRLGTGTLRRRPQLGEGLLETIAAVDMHGFASLAVKSE